MNRASIIRKNRFLYLIVFLLIGTAGCGTTTKSKEYIVLNPEKVTISVLSDSFEENSITIGIHDENGRGKIGYSRHFIIEKKNDGNWQEAEKSKSNHYIFDDMQYFVDADGNLELELSWNQLYKPLKAGEYRLLLEVEELESGENEKNGDNITYISVGFQVN